MMSKNTKEKILEKAFHLFTNRSYEVVTIDKIAEKADVSKGAVFHYFDSKHELANRSIFHYMENNWMPIYKELNKMDDPDTMLRKSIGYSFEFFFKNPKFMRFFMDLYEKNKDEDVIEKHLDDFYKELLEMGTKMFKELGAEKPRLKSHLFTACIDGMALQFTFFGELEDFPDTEDLKNETYNIFTERRNDP